MSSNDQPAGLVNEASDPENDGQTSLGTTKRAASTTETHVEGNVSSKRARLSTHPDTDGPLDLAITLGYSPGDRIQVKWEVESAEAASFQGKSSKQQQPQSSPLEQHQQEKGEKEEGIRGGDIAEIVANTDSSDDPSGVITHWWGATLLEHDGRTEDSVAIRVLQYDPFPEGGFPDPSFEDVIFLGHDLLVSPDSRFRLNFRREVSKDSEPVIWFNENDLHEQLNSILMTALQNHQNAWKSLPPAQQAAIAEKIAVKKEKLINVLKSYDAVITSSSIHEILRQAFG